MMKTTPLGMWNGRNSGGIAVPHAAETPMAMLVPGASKTTSN